MILCLWAAVTCTSCYLQIVICWQGLCHDTLLTYLLHLLQQPCFVLQAAHGLLLLYSYQRQQAPGCASQTHLHRAAERHGMSEVLPTAYIPHLSQLLWAAMIAASHFDFYWASLLLAFRTGLGEMKCSHWGEGTNRQRLEMEFAQWSEIPIQKIDFVHKLEFEVSKGRFTQVLHQVSAILWLLAPGARVWVTDYTTAVSGPSYFCTPASPIRALHIHMSALCYCLPSSKSKTDVSLAPLHEKYASYSCSMEKILPFYKNILQQNQILVAL